MSVEYSHDPWLQYSPVVASALRYCPPSLQFSQGLYSAPSCFLCPLFLGRETPVLPSVRGLSAMAADLRACELIAPCSFESGVLACQVLSFLNATGYKVGLGSVQSTTVSYDPLNHMQM